MIDPKTGFITQEEQHETAHEILNPCTGVLTSLAGYPCIDLVNNSDEEQDTEEGGPKSIKRVWRETNKKEWLKIYQEYMDQRLKRQPQPLRSEECLEKGRTVGRSGFRNTGRTKKRPNARKGTPGSDKHVKTLKRFAKRRKVGGSGETSDSCSSEKIPERSKRDLSSDNLERVRNDNELRVDDEIVVIDLDEPDIVEGNSEDLSECIEEEKVIFKKIKRDKLLKNSLKLLKYSNICPFKWTRYYFACIACLEWFKDMGTLRNHVNGHTCRQITKKLAIDKHTYHKADITDLECRICSFKLNSLRDLEIHLTEHGIGLEEGGSSFIPYKLCNDAFVCQLCQECFPTSFRLHKHMDNHFLNYACPECNMRFPNSRSLKKHWVKTASNPRTSKSEGQKLDPESRFKCSQCTEKFKYNYTRLEHLINDHGKASRIFQCEFCPKVFMTVHWLTKHMNCVHQDELYS